MENIVTTGLLKRIGGFDLEATALNIFRKFDNETRIIFGSSVLLNVFAWFIFIAHHPLHNHVFRMPWMGWNEQVYLGRWFNRIVLRMVHAADMPVFLPVLASVLAVISALFTLRVWKLNLSGIEKFIIVGLISTFPFFLSFYYYTWLTPLFMFSCVFAAGAAAVSNSLKPLPILMGSGLFMLMMASYQPGIGVYATLSAGAIIVGLTQLNQTPLIEVAKAAGARILTAVFGGIAYLVSLEVLNIGKSHATSTIELSDIPEKFLTTSEAAFRHLTITQPEFHPPLKFMLLSLLVVGFLGSLWLARKSVIRIALLPLIWVGLILATKTMFYVSTDTNFFQYRYNFALAFLYAFGIAMALNSMNLRLVRSFLLICAAFVLVRFVQVDLIRQEVLLRGQQHDLAIANRVLARVEALPDFDANKTYDFVRVGKYAHFREEILSSRGRKAETYGDGHMDHGEIADRWADEQMMILLGSSIKFKITGFDPEFSEKMSDFRARYGASTPKWPHADSVFIEGDTIYVYMH